ncbi:hypothetical protein QBC36DRAFT_364581 [Triangularia setosa]|uniref:Uncharacterized protein n=1 Tax=Triangularia setosa TaxID=2587417 RepID=A0AAN7A1K9_9PEZI|nr:hypothetical protein QBC36DRAFT_364581 [Podospora setosa]
MMCQLTARSQWNVMLRFLDGADGESMADREWAVRRLAMSESSFLEAVPFVVVAEVTSIASFVFSRHREMLIDFFDELFDARKSITPTGEEVEEETQPEEPPGSSRHFTPDEWEKENLLYLSSAVGMGLGYLEKVQRLSHVSRRAWFRTILGHFQPAEHSYYRVLTERWDVLVRPLEELGGTFQVEELVGMPPQPRPSSHFVSGSYDAASHPGFNHIFSGRAASEYSLTNLMELGWPFWDLDRTEALDGALRLRSAYSDSVWRVLHTSAELGDPLLNCPFWLPERVWRPIIRKMLTPDFDGSDPFSITMGTPSGMEIGSGHGRRWEKDDERKLSLEERVDRAKQRLEFFRDLMSNLDRYYAIGAAGKIRGRLD